MSAASEQSDEILVLYRSSGELFGGTDLHVLSSVAQRLRIAAEDRERAVAIERLAAVGAPARAPPGLRVAADARGANSCSG